MPDNGQSNLFYEDFYDAIDKAIASSGRTKKELACILYPGRQIETAKSLLTRALSPENTDVHLSIEALLTIMKETRPEDVIHFLCDEFGFERPMKRGRESFERELKGRVKHISDDLKIVVRRLQHLERGDD